MGSRRFEDDYIQKRMKFLQKFMNSILESEVFKANESLISFLSVNDRSQFESKIKEMNSFQPSPYVEEIKTLTGILTVADADDEESEKYFSNIRNYFKLQSQIFKRLSKNWKHFYVNMTAACSSLERVQKDFEHLNVLNTRVMMKPQITKTFEELGLFVKNWKKILIKQNYTVKSHLRDFYKYVRMEGTSYSELIKHRDEVKAKYVAEHTKLNEKKEKLWKGWDISKWEIVDEFNKVDKCLLCKDKVYAMSMMWTKESKNLESLKKQVGYANKMNIEELKNMVRDNLKKYICNLQSFSEEFYPTLTEGLTIYSFWQMFVAQFAE